MLKKKVEVVELNKKEEKIILEEKQSALILFFRRHRLLIFLTALILSLTAVIIGILLFVKNAGRSEKLTIKEVSVQTSLNDYEANVTTNGAMTEEDAINYFKKNGLITGNGEIVLLKTIQLDKYTIHYFSDGMAMKIKNDGTEITKIKALDNGKYGIDENGNINTKAITSDITVKETKNYSWGTVTYYSDGSALITNSNVDMFVRNAKDIGDNYISTDKVAYLKETKKVGNNTLNYYYDGTIEIVKNNKSYIVRSEADITISGNDIIFNNYNQAEIINTLKTDNDMEIYYYSDGGAIIKYKDNTISVRKSNSIVIKDKKLYEITNSVYDEKSKTTEDATYYTNGGAVVDYNGKTYYVPENSDIKYNDDGSIKTIGTNVEELTKTTNIDGDKVQTFEKTAVVETNEYIAIVPSDGVVYDQEGHVKDIQVKISDEELKSFEITNNTNELLNYRVVIKQSNRTTVDVSYLRYQLSNNVEYVKPKILNSDIWKEDKLYKAFNINGTNYILIDGIIEPYDTDTIVLMLWADYDTIPNSQMDKYFYGTIKVYGWTEE